MQFRHGTPLIHRHIRYALVELSFVFEASSQRFVDYFRILNLQFLHYEHVGIQPTFVFKLSSLLCYTQHREIPHRCSVVIKLLSPFLSLFCTLLWNILRYIVTSLI